MESIKLRGALTLLFSILLWGCNAQEETQNYTYKLLDSKQFEQRLIHVAEAQLVDVRTRGEYNKGAIPRAINYDILDGTFEKNIKTLDKSKPIFIYCAKGGRSSKASKILQKEGFKEIYDLKGGYTSWEIYEKKE